MRVGHLFAGAGGGLYADLILGHKSVFAVEWDDYAAGVLQKRTDTGWFPELHVYHGDVRMFDASPWKGRVDSLHAGFPCQDISVAGSGEGIEGERSGLWSEVRRAAIELGYPELFLENSPAITSRGLDIILGDLAELGYDARWCVLPASAVGAPHLRARWWCLARRSDTGKELCRQGGFGEPERALSDRLCKGVMGNTHCTREQQPQGGQCDEWGWSSNSGQDVSDANQKRLQERIILGGREGETGSAFTGQEAIRGDWWSVEPSVGRVVNGLADRVNRVACLGNGQVPLQAATAYMILDAGMDS